MDEATTSRSGGTPAAFRHATFADRTIARTASGQGASVTRKAGSLREATRSQCRATPARLLVLSLSRGDASGILHAVLVGQVFNWGPRRKKLCGCCRTDLQSVHRTPDGLQIRPTEI